MFLWAKQLLRKAEIVENFITFYTLNVGLFANIKKTILKTKFQKLDSRLNIFAVYWT